jgi:hypothetical protein
MHPYRDMATPVEDAPRPNREELVLHGLLAAIGAIPVAVALVSHERFGLDATLGLLMALVGAAGFVRQRRARARATGNQRRPR